MLNVRDNYTVDLLNLFQISARSFLQTDYLNSLKDRKVSKVQTKNPQLNFFSLRNESCSVSFISLHYRGLKPISCLTETGLCTVDFWKIVKHKTINHEQHVIVKDQIATLSFQRVCSLCVVTFFGYFFISWMVLFDGTIYNIYLKFFTVNSIIVLLFNCFPYIWFSWKILELSSKNNCIKPSFQKLLPTKLRRLGQKKQRETDQANLIATFVSSVYAKSSDFEEREKRSYSSI